MIKWELAARYALIEDGEPSSIWTKKDKGGSTEWDSLLKLANEGWELVSVTPVTSATYYWQLYGVRDAGGWASSTRCLLYTFKRPKPD